MKRSYTLIEILVTFSIVIILACILYSGGIGGPKVVERNYETGEIHVQGTVKSIRAEYPGHIIKGEYMRWDPYWDMEKKVYIVVRER